MMDSLAHKLSSTQGEVLLFELLRVLQNALIGALQNTLIFLISAHVLVVVVLILSRRDLGVQHEQAGAMGRRRHHHPFIANNIWFVDPITDAEETEEQPDEGDDDDPLLDGDNDALSDMIGRDIARVGVMGN